MTEPLQFDVTQLRGSLREDEPMAKHVSWRAGGRAARAYVPRDLADLQVFLPMLPQQEPVCFVGLGSNLLVRDGGYAGTVVLMHDTHGEIRLEADLVFAAAGVAAPKVARFAATHGFEGAEFLAGVPGTVGGALAMNAGCYGGETWDYVVRADTIDRAGRLRAHKPGDYELGYRHCVLKGTMGTTLPPKSLSGSPGRSGSPPPGSASLAATARRRARGSRNCSRAGSRPSRSTCRTPARCSATRRVSTPRASSRPAG